MVVSAPKVGSRSPAASADTLARSASKAAARSRRGVATCTMVPVSVRVSQAPVQLLNQCGVSRSLVSVPLLRERVFLSVGRRWYNILHFTRLWLFRGSLHAYLLKGVCDFTFKSLALWEFLCFFFNFFPNDCEWVRCRTGREWEQRLVLGHWYGVLNQSITASLLSVLAFYFFFLQLSPFIKLSICGIHVLLLFCFTWPLLSLFISSSYETLCDNLCIFQFQFSQWLSILGPCSCLASWLLPCYTNLLKIIWHYMYTWENPFHTVYRPTISKSLSPFYSLLWCIHAQYPRQ